MVWAEHFRLDGLADNWEQADLIELSLLGVLSPSDVLPRDWQTVTGMLGRLSVEAGFLGGVAITLARDLARDIAAFNAMARAWADESPQQSESARLAFVRSNYAYAESLATHSKGLRSSTRQLSLLFWDACQQSRAAKKQRTLNFSDDLRSELAREAVHALKKREAEKQVADSS
jgi:hypothetical protein